MRWISAMRVWVFVGVLSGLLSCACPARAASVFMAYQRVYDMKFEVFALAELPPEWFATLDGYAVMEISTNHWVYGRVGQYGDIAPTGVAVGSVVPMFVPELSRIDSSMPLNGAYTTKEFQDVLCSGVDTMAVLDDPFLRTPVAWRSGEMELMVWLGNRWLRIVPSGTQTAGQAIAARSKYIVSVLHEKRGKYAAWTWADTENLANLARSWGCLWQGYVTSVSMSQRGREGAGGSDGAMGLGSGSPGTPGSPGSPGGNWDTSN